MSTAGWAVLAAVAWCGAGVLVGLAIGRMVRRRDYEVDAVVESEMAGVDDEYKALCGGGR